MAGSSAQWDRTFPSWALNHPLRRLRVRPSRVLARWGPRPGEVVADLGAGNGYFLPTLAGLVGARGRLYAVDVDPEALARAKRGMHRLGVPTPITWLTSSAAELSAIPTGSVDFVLSYGLLCCMVDKASAMKEMARVLRPGGRALVAFQTWGFGGGARARALRLSEPRWSQLIDECSWTLVSGPRGIVRRTFFLTRQGEAPGRPAG